jgi:hypothetical protein
VYYRHGKETINNFNPAHDVIDLPQSMFANFAAVQADVHVSGSNTIIMSDADDAPISQAAAVKVGLRARPPGQNVRPVNALK